MKICWVKILTPVAGGSTGAYVVSPPCVIMKLIHPSMHSDCHSNLTIIGQPLLLLCGTFMLDYADVPPLEDMSEELEKIKSLRTQNKGVKQSDTISPPQDVSLKLAASANGSKNKQATKESIQTVRTKEKTSSSSKSSFGGFKKGFLVSSSDSKPQVKKAAPTKKTPAVSPSAAGASSKDSDIPFIKPKDKGKSSLEFPEVQEAMKEAFPLLQSKGMYIVASVFFPA